MTIFICVEETPVPGIRTEVFGEILWKKKFCHKEVQKVWLLHALNHRVILRRIDKDKGAPLSQYLVYV
jgi:hypothetical protein